MLANKVFSGVRKDLEQQIAYFNALDEDKQGALMSDNQRAMQMLQQIQQMEQYFRNPVPVPAVDPEGQKSIINNVPQDTNKADAVNPKKK